MMVSRLEDDTEHEAACGARSDLDAAECCILNAVQHLRRARKDFQCADVEFEIQAEEILTSLRHVRTDLDRAINQYESPAETLSVTSLADREWAARRVM